MLLKLKENKNGCDIYKNVIFWDFFKQILTWKYNRMHLRDTLNVAL